MSIQGVLASQVSSQYPQDREVLAAVQRIQSSQLTSPERLWKEKVPVWEEASSEKGAGYYKQPSLEDVTGKTYRVFQCILAMAQGDYKEMFQIVDDLVTREIVRVRGDKKEVYIQSALTALRLRFSYRVQTPNQSLIASTGCTTFKAVLDYRDQPGARTLREALDYSRFNPFGNSPLWGQTSALTNVLAGLPSST